VIKLLPDRRTELAGGPTATEALNKTTEEKRGKQKRSFFRGRTDLGHGAGKGGYSNRVLEKRGFGKN